jgi:hypothetical protein
MKRPFALLLAVVATASSAVVAAPSPSTATAERVAASHLLAFGEPAGAEQLSRARQPGQVTVAALQAEHRQRLQSDAAAQQRAAARAFEDAFGRPPADAELAGAAGTYTDLLQQHLARLAQSPDEYRRVMDRAYRLVIHRPVYDIELAYWKDRAVLPYVLLVGCIEGWARRNAPGLMATTGNPCLGVNSALVQTLSVSPAVAAEVRAAFGLQAAESEPLAIAAGHNVIAPGADGVSSLGGMFIVVVGDRELAKG